MCVGRKFNHRERRERKKVWAAVVAPRACGGCPDLCRNGSKNGNGVAVPVNGWLSREINRGGAAATALPYFHPATVFIRFIKQSGVNWGMMKNPKGARRRPPLKFQPLADGQVWRMADAVLQVTTVGKLLVHYKLGKPDAIRVSNSVKSIATIEKYLKANKAVLV